MDGKNTIVIRIKAEFFAAWLILDHINFRLNAMMGNANLPVLSISSPPLPIAELRTSELEPNSYLYPNGYRRFSAPRTAPNRLRIRVDPNRLEELTRLWPSISQYRNYNKSPPPGSGAVRLDDFLNPPPPPPSAARLAFETESPASNGSAACRVSRPSAPHLRISWSRISTGLFPTCRPIAAPIAAAEQRGPAANRLGRPPCMVARRLLGGVARGSPRRGDQRRWGS